MPLLTLKLSPDPAIFWTLLAILVASTAMFWFLVARSTGQRQWLALADWAQANEFKLHGEKNAIFPEALATLLQPPPRVLISLNDPDTALVQIETQRNSDGTWESARWNLLVRRIETAWPVTCARPRGHSRSIFDYLPLLSMYANASSERFVLYGAEQVSVRALAKSSASSGLLPADVGLLLTGHYLILDFSTRPFDALSLQRLDSLAEQLVAHLPSTKQG
jgi:hypothetical protein